MNIYLDQISNLRGVDFGLEAYPVLIQCFSYDPWSSANGRVKLMPVSLWAWHHLESAWSAGGSSPGGHQLGGSPCPFFFSISRNFSNVTAYQHTELQHVPECLFQDP